METKADVHLKQEADLSSDADKLQLRTRRTRSLQTSGLVFYDGDVIVVKLVHFHPAALSFAPRPPALGSCYD